MRIIDTTLREGEQAVGVSFDLAAKQRIIDGLVGLGVDEIELGIASALCPDVPRLCRYIRRRHPRQSFSLWCRCRAEDIDFAAALRPDIISLSIPASDLHLSKKLAKSREWAQKRLAESLKRAHGAGLKKIAVGLEDASRADHNFITELAGIAAQGRAFRLRLADTVGISSPADIGRLLRTLDGSPLESGVHCHNDFGMATANTINAFEQGATWADVTILGLGERAGNSRLEEVLGYLALKKQVGKYDLLGLNALSNFVAGLAGRDIGPARPILGAEIFSCETGLHLQGLLADPATYEPFAPERLGRKRIFRIGTKAGKRSVAATLRRLGLGCPDEISLISLTRDVRNMAGRQQRSLTDHELLDLAMIRFSGLQGDSPIRSSVAFDKGRTISSPRQTQGAVD